MHVNDCKLAALEAQTGQTGHINDLFLLWLQNNGATSDNIMEAQREFLQLTGISSGHINDMWYAFLARQGFEGALADMWYQFWCDTGGELAPPTTLYVNSKLEGGEPPTAHTIGFGTVPYTMSLIPGQTDVFQFESNAGLATGRCYLTYQVNENNPDLVVGETYEITYLVNNMPGGNSGTVITSAQISNVTADYTQRNMPPGSGFNQVGVRFTIDADPWTLQIRVGTGTSADQDNHVIAKFPRLVQV